MSLFSFLRKNKQETAPNTGEFQSRAAEESDAIRGRGKRKAAAADEPADPVLPEKKRARRRLIGAIALVLAAVIGLPMIFDTEPKPLAQDIDIQIPSKDKQAQTAARRTAASLAASASLDQSEQIVESPASEPRAKPDEAKAESQAETKLTVPAADQKISDKVAEKAALKTEVKPVAKAATDEKAQAQAELRGADKPATAKVAADAKGKYAIQVAALKTPEKINELRGKLKRAGIDSYTQKVATESGESTRIRVGPFATKEEADKMNARLAKLGFNGKIVP